MNKNETRQRRARQTRIKIAELLAHRLTVIRSNCHISAQVYSPCGSKVVAAASTMEKDLRTSVKNGGNSQAAQTIGKLIAERAKKAGVEALLLIVQDIVTTAALRPLLKLRVKPA